jgi:ribosome-associated translation inhibitor RaiA
MQLSTTYRGLSRAESAAATSNLERNLTRLDRLLERPVQVRAVVEGGPPEIRVILSMAVDREDLLAQSSGHDLSAAINTACERLRNQLVKRRERRRETGRQKSTPPAPA